MLNALRTKKSMNDTLIQVDKQFELRELLSTAYETFEQGRKSIFTNIIIRDAAKYLANKKSDQILPKRFTKIHLLILLFIFIVFNLMSLYFTYAPSMPKALTDTNLKNISDELESYAQNGLSELEDTEENTQMNMFEQMNEIAGNLKDQPYQDEDLLRQFEELKDKAEAERSRITRKLETELNLGDTTETPLFNPLRDDISEAELEEFKDTLNQLFEGETPPSLSKEIENLKNLRKLELFLDKATEDIDQNVSKGNILSVLEDQETDGSRAEVENQEALGGEVIPGKNMDFPAPLVRIPPMEGPKKPGTMEIDPDDLESKGEKSSSAGFGKDDAGTVAAEDTEGLKNSAIRDENLSEGGTRYSLQVLALPLNAEAGVEEEEILRTYEKEIESVLNREEIPENYREYIKNYFLSIGIGSQNQKSDF